VLKEEELERLTEVFRTLFDIPDIEIRDSLAAKDIDDWDSFNHINLIINIEQEFNVRFTSEEVSGMQNVGDLKKILAAKIYK
jgi:acyl carrier protein